MRRRSSFSAPVFALIVGLATAGAIASCAQGSSDVGGDDEPVDVDARELAIDAPRLPIDAAPLPIDAAPLPIDAAPLPIDAAPPMGGACTSNGQCTIPGQCCFGFPPGEPGLCVSGTVDPIFGCLPG